MDDLDFLTQLTQMQQAAQTALQAPTLPPVKARVQQTSAPKQAAVAEASANKRQALTQQDLNFEALAAHRESGRGELALGELGRILAPSQSLERILEYGSDVERALNLGQSEALLERRRIQTQEEPTLAQQAGEAALDLVGGGILDPVGHMGAWVVGQYSPAAGAYLADSMAQGQQFRESLKTRATQDQNRLTRQQQELAALDSQILRQQDHQQHGDLLSSLRQIGRDTLSDLQITLESPAALRAGTAQGVGTILTGSVIGRTLAGLAGRATTGELTIPTIREITDAMPVAIGLMEGSSTYVDTVNAVQALPIEALREYSDVFAPTVQVYLEKGLDQAQAEQRARDAVAHMAGNLAAVPHAFLAGATGKMVARFEADPLNQFKRGLPSKTPPKPVKKALTTVAVTEPTEEAIQSSSGETLSNLAIGQTADRRQEWDEGVGSQLAQGALFGSLSAATIQLPTGALAVGMHGANKALAGTERALDALRTRAERIQKELEQDSPVADAKLAEAGEQAAVQAGAALEAMEAGIAATAATTTPDERQSASDYARQLIASVQFDNSPEAMTEAGIPEYFHDVLKDANNRVTAVQQLAAMVEATEGDPELQLQTAGVLYSLLEPIGNLDLRDEAAIAALPKEHIAHQIDRGYQGLLQNLARSATVHQALAKVTALLQNEQAPALDVSETNLATPAGQQNIQTAVTLAQHHPDRANADTNTTILKHADEGRIQLDPFQRQALQASVALVQARRDVLAERARLGHTSTVDVVSDQVLTGRDPLRAQAKSAAQHTRDILRAYSAGNLELASAFLEDFRLFTQHMQNKLGAFNAHFRGGDPRADGVSYQAISPGEERRWYQSPERLKVHPTRPGSVNLAQTVALEARALADIYENLAEVFPELSPRNIQRQSLDPLLDGPPETVAQEFQQGQRQVPSQTAEPTPEPATPQEPVAAPPVAEPARTEPVPQQPTPTPAEAVPAPVAEPVTAPELPPVGHYVRYKNSVRLVIRHNPDGTLQLADPRAEGSNQSVKVSPRNVTRTRHRPAAIIASERGYPVITTATGVRYSTRTGKRLADAPPPAPEPVAEPESVLEPTPEPGVEVSPEVEPAAPAAVVAPDTGQTRLQGLAAVFPNLYRSVSKRIRNFFLEGFRIPTKQRSHLLGQEAPLAWVRDAIARSDRLNQGNVPPRLRQMNQEILDAYAALLSSEPTEDGFSVGSLIAQLQAQMAAFLESDGLGEKFKNGTPIHRYMRGKTANLLEETETGFRYQPALLEAAALAGVQWLLAGQTDPQLSTDQVAALFQLTDPAAIDQLTVKMNTGVSQTSAVRSLAHKIRNYWGVVPDPVMDKAYTDAIPTAMAAEVMRALKELGLVQVTVVRGPDVAGRGVLTFNRIETERLVEESPLRRYPNAIERTVLTEPEVRVRFGSDRAPVPQTQLHTPQVKLTREQKLALELEANTPFRFNVGAINFFREIGEDGVLELFGTPDLDNRPMNVNHRRSEQGRNTQLLSAFRYLNRVLDEALYEAQVTNTPLGELEMFFGYDFHRANRMQMGDSFNPQSNTLLRELVLPTRSLLDLTTAKHQLGFQLALAQALGVSVHTQLPAVSAERAEALLTNELAPVVRLLQGWLQAADTEALSLAGTGLLRPALLRQIKAYFAEAGVALTPVALHAVVEYARSQSLTQSERSRFQTDFYLEADGMTNGPINAIMLLSSGEFDSNQIANLRRGGLAIGMRKTAAELRALDRTDLYQAATQNTITAVNSLFQSLRSNTPVQDQMQALLQLMDQFLPDLTYRDGALDMTRNILKNPLTVILYGAQNAGIARKLVESLSDAMYQRMSEAVQRQSEDPALTPAQALFPQAAEPEVEFQRLIQNLKALTNQVVEAVWVKGVREHFLTDTPQPASSGRSFAEFTLTAPEVNNLVANMQALLVEPMVEGITRTMGPELMANMRLVRASTQAQSLVYSFLFRQELDALRERRRKDPHFRKGEFVSQAELDEIHAKLARANIVPLVQTPGQTTLISKSEGISINELNYARALDDSFATPAEVELPADPGVAGIPNLVIGLGDGLAMLTASLMESIQGTLKIFDGVNMPLDKIEDYSPLLNQAVWQSWQTNPFRGIEQMLSKFLHSPLLQKAALSEEEVFTVLAALHGDWAVTEMVNNGLPLTMDTLLAHIGAMRKTLADRAQAKDARIQVLSQIPFSLDQMAAAGAPYVHRQAEPLEGSLSIAGTVTRLNQLLVEAQQAPLPPPNPMPAELLETGHLSTSAPVVTEPAPEPTREAPPALTADPELNTTIDLLSEQEPQSRARVVKFTTLMRQHQTLPLTEEQRVIVDEIRRSGVLDDYTVVYGDAAQLNAHRADQGLEPLDLAPAEGTTHGAIDTDARVMYLLTDSGTTLVHEMIHGATFLTVLDYYRDPSKYRNQPVAGAIARLEGLMQQFLELGEPAEGLLQRSPLQQAQAVVQSALLDPTRDQATAKAIALNEFMAWALSEPEIAAQLKLTQAPAWVVLAQKVIAEIKRLVWGRKWSPKTGPDSLANLQFNTGILVRSQQRSLATALQTTALYHQSQGPGLADPRLHELRELFGSRLARFLKTDLPGPEEQRGVAQTHAQSLLQEALAAGFDLTPEAQGVFQMIVTALGTAMTFDSSVLTRLQELLVHTNKAVELADFMQTPEVNDPQDEYQALNKYNYFTGKFSTLTDTQGRSYLLPVFVALAATSPEVRELLQAKPVPTPSKARSPHASLDTVVDGHLAEAMHQLTTRLAGDHSARNVRQAVDQLIQGLEQVNQYEENLIERHTNRANDYLVEKLGDLSDQGVALAERLDQSEQQLTRFTGSVIGLMSRLISSRNSNNLSEGLQQHMNKENLWEPYRAFVSDLLGRTTKNASIYDMIKHVRTAVQQLRQRHRDTTPKTIAAQFSRPLQRQEWSALTQGLAKTHIVSLARGRTKAAVRELLSSPVAVRHAIQSLETQVSQHFGQHWAIGQRKAKQLATFLMTEERGEGLLRNAKAVSRLFGEVPHHRAPRFSPEQLQDLEQLITLYALEQLSEADRTSIQNLLNTGETQGIDFLLDFLLGQDKDERQRAQGTGAEFNGYMGYLPLLPEHGGHLTVQDSSQHAQMLAKGYVPIGNYDRSSLDPHQHQLTYYYSANPRQATFNQGLMQTIRQTAFGVDRNTGFSMDYTVERITEPRLLRRYRAQLARGQAQTGTPLSPVWSSNGELLALERTIAPEHLTRLQRNTQLHQMLAVWWGRQVEEGMSQEINQQLIRLLREQYDQALSENRQNQRHYVDLLSNEVQANDPVIRDAMRLMSPEMRELVKEEFGDQFWVERGLVKDVIGERSASVGDFWTGTTRWSEPTQRQIRQLATTVFGRDAYRYLTQAERHWQGLMADARTLIVVKSVIVPMFNFTSTMLQLVSRGVSLLTIAKSLPKKLVEVEAYVRSYNRLVEAEAELRSVANRPQQRRKLMNEIRAIHDSHQRMSIWPLIQAGELSTIADLGQTREDLQLVRNDLSGYLKSKIDGLSPGARDAVRYGFITRGTPLFRALQKSVQYGDFLGKAILYDFLVHTKGRTVEEALGQITDEFVHYDKLPGRARSALENNGLLWFYNFKIRAAKVAVSTVRENPLNALVAALMPLPAFLESSGTAVTDNIFSQAAEGTLGYSIGPGMAVRAPTLLPWYQLIE